MQLVELPDELILAIAEALELFQDIANLSLGNKHLLNILNPFIYRLDARWHSSEALLWAARQSQHRPDVATKAIEAAVLVSAKTLMKPIEHGKEYADRDDIDFSFFDNGDSTVLEHQSSSHIGHVPLKTAAQLGNAEMVKLLLTVDGIDPDWRDVNLHASPFFYAAARNRLAVVDVLLDTGKIDVNQVDKSGVPAIWFAAGRSTEDGHLVVQSILRHGCSVANQPHPVLGSTPFQRAVISGHNSVVKVMLESGLVDVNAYFPDSTLPLFQAIDHNRTETIKTLVEVGGADINACLAHGVSPLSCACQRDGRDHIVTYLLSCNRLNIGTGSEDRPQLFLWAAKTGREDCIKMVLAANTAAGRGVEGLDIDRAVSFAAQEGHVGVMQVFIEHGFDVSGQSQIDDPMYALLPISLAARRGQNHMIELLLQSGKLDDTWKKFQYNTPLFNAVRSHKTETVRLLCERGAGVGREGGPRNTQVLSDMYSACLDHSDILAILLEYGAAPDVAARARSWTPLHIAAACKNENLVASLLQDNCVNASAVDANGVTAAQLAFSDDHASIRSLLRDHAANKATLPKVDT